MFGTCPAGHGRTITNQSPVQSPPFTYTIVDWRGTRLPLKGSISAQYRKLPDNVLVVIVLTDSFAHSMVHIGIKMRNDNQFVTCRSIEEAEKIINRHRAERSLPTLELVNWVNTFATSMALSPDP
jgi:hypothetical protein